MTPFLCWTLFLSLLLLQESAPAPAPVTPIPADAARMVNPYKPTPESQARARKIYGYDCALCHGESGDGKGEAAVDMKLKMRNFTDPETLKDLTDGELFYIIRHGKGGMPAEEEGRAKDEDVWNMVVLARSFAKK